MYWLAIDLRLLLVAHGRTLCLSLWVVPMTCVTQVVTDVVETVRVETPVAHHIGRLSVYVVSSDHAVEATLRTLTFDCLNAVACVTPTTTEGHTIIRCVDDSSLSVFGRVLSDDGWYNLLCHTLTWCYTLIKLFAPRKIAQNLGLRF